MHGIQSLAHYLPAGRIRNSELLKKFGMDEAFLKNKIGFLERSVKSPDELVSDLCLRAWEALQQKTGIHAERIEAAVVVTQNPDFAIPHVSAMVQGRAGFPKTCACFDISLGCSGYVYGLSILSSFMQANGLNNGLLFTADPYSKIVNPEDRDTSLLFGDAATVTLLSDEGRFFLKRFKFGTDGTRFDSLLLKDRFLQMKGADILRFAVDEVPPQVQGLLQECGLSLESIDKFVIHPGSQHVLKTLTHYLGIDPKKVARGFENYGNTVSSSLPLLLETLENDTAKTFLLSGFGVGLSWASAIIERV